MADTKRVNQILEKLGYEAEEGKSIVVSYAPENLSDKIMKKFLWNNFYMLSICKESVVLIPFYSIWQDLKKEVALELPFPSIRKVEVSEEGLNYRITIQLEDETISLIAQQGELSFFRYSGYFSLETFFGDNWHRRNLKETLKALKELGGREDS